MSVDFSVGCIEDGYKEDQGQAEVNGVMTLQNCTIIYWFVTTAYVPNSFDTTVYWSVLTRAPVDTPKPSSQPSDDTLLSSISNPITA